MGRTKGSGQGSIYRRGDKWRGQITINGQRLSHTAKKKADVIAWIDKVKAEPTPVAKQNITVQELAEYWLEHVKEPSVRPQTYNNAESRLRNHLYPVLGKYKVQDLTREIIEEAYPKMFDGDYKDSTVNSFMAQFRMLLKYAVKEKIIFNNPHDDVIIRKRNNTKKVDAFTEEDQRKLVEYLKSSDMRDSNAIFYLLIATGMRAGEAGALTWGDIDLGKGAINITKTVVNIRGRVFVQDHPKTAAGNRTVYVSKNVIQYLRKYHDRKEVTDINDRLFNSTKGNLYHAVNLQYRWRRTCAAAGIPYKGLHSLRHSFATRALEKGIDIKTVSSILGHKNVVTTMNLYQDVYSGHKIRTAEIMNDLF